MITDQEKLKNFIRTHLRLARASNLPTVWSNVFCAFILSGGYDWWSLLGAVVAVSLFYVGGMYLNDWWDAEFDRENCPERPIPSKQISRKAVLLYAIGYFLVAVTLSILLQPESLWWALGLITCIALYDWRHKNNLLSPWIMAGCRALIYPWAASVAGVFYSTELWIACLAAYIYTLSLTYIARGPRKTILNTVICCTCVLVPALLWGWRMHEYSRIPEYSLWMGFLAMVLFVGWSVYSLSGWFKDPSSIGLAVGNLIAGFLFVDLLAISVTVSVTIVIPLLFILLFIATLKIQTIISGT